MKIKESNSQEPNENLDLKAHTVIGLAVSILMFGGISAWATIAHLNGAVIASGNLVVESNLKKIQHPTGGIIGEIKVKEGQQIQKGDLLVRFDQTITRSNLQIIKQQLYQMYGRQARLQAEFDGKDKIDFLNFILEDPKKEPEIDRVIAGETAIFNAHILQRKGQKAQLSERIIQLKHEIEGLEAQRNAKEKEISLISTELIGVQELYKKNLIPITRLTALQRESSRLDGERGALIAQVASARGKISEIELQILNLDGDLRSEATRELREVDSKINELNERRIAAEDQMNRIDLRSPVDGTVHQLLVHTIGGVVQPSEILMYIVPADDKLVVELKVAPNDIEPIKVGSSARVRFTSLNQRTTPEIFGDVTNVGADAARDQQSGTSYFLVRVSIPREENEKLGAQRLVPGMPAEVFIQTNPRTVLSYLIKPIADQFERALRER